MPRRVLPPDNDGECAWTALLARKRGVHHVPLCAGMLPFQLSLCRSVETRTLEYAAAVAAGEIRPPSTDWPVDIQDTVIFRTLPVVAPAGEGETTAVTVETSIKRYIQLTVAADKARMAPVWMSLLLLLRWRGLDIRLTCVTVQPSGFPSFVVWPLLHMVARGRAAADADGGARPPPTPTTVFLPTHDAWDNGFVCYRFGGVPGLPFHLLAARTELFMSAVAVILLRCRWPPRDRDVRIDEVRSDADRTTFRVRTLPSPCEEEEQEAAGGRTDESTGIEEVSPISVRLEDDTYGLTIDHRRGYHAPLMVGGGLDGLTVRYVCPGCARVNDAAASAAAAAGVCRACGFFLPDAMVDEQPIRFTFRLRPHLR
jgi:hypothetical protein